MSLTPKEPEITKIKKFKMRQCADLSAELVIYLDISDTLKGFSWRLRSIQPDVIGEWIYNYMNFPTLKVNEKTFAIASRYWEGVLPVEEPFLITPLDAIK